MLDLIFSYALLSHVWMTFVPALPCFMIPFINPRPTSTKKKKQKRKGLMESMFWFFCSGSPL